MPEETAAPSMVSLKMQVAMGPVMAEAWRGGDPDAGVLDDIAHLEHGSAQALADDAAPTVFPEGHDGEAHHLCAAACHSSAAGQTGQTQCRADGCGGDGQGQSDAHDDGDQDTHQERLQLGGPHDDLTHGDGGCTDGRRNGVAEAHACQDGDGRCDQDVNFRLLGDRLAQLCCDDGR